jgi:hypothetical protein
MRILADRKRTFRGDALGHRGKQSIDLLGQGLFCGRDFGWTCVTHEDALFSSLPQLFEGTGRPMIAAKVTLIREFEFWPLRSAEKARFDFLCILLKRHKQMPYSICFSADL